MYVDCLTISDNEEDLQEAIERSLCDISPTSIPVSKMLDKVVQASENCTEYKRSYNKLGKFNTSLKKSRFFIMLQVIY